MSFSVWADLIERYVASVGRGWHWWAIGLVVLGLLLIPKWRPRRRARLWVLGLLIVLGTAYAAGLAWVADDAFISFRYARNLVDGHGLVYNPGERVEGYTNFLWTMLVAGGLLLGLHPTVVALVLGLGCLAGCLWLTARLAAQLGGGKKRRSALPLAATALAGNYIFASYGTSGLETMAAALLVLVALDRALAKAPLQAGVAGIAATMMHPDHAIFYVSLGAVQLGDRGRRRRLWRYALPLGLIYVPYFLWRFRYYGDLLPNTFYAKSGGAFYFSQGARFLVISALAGGLLAVLPLAAVALVRQRRQLLARYVLLSTVIYLVYVAKIGGDFMLGRLLLPVLPPLFLLAEIGVRQLLAERRRLLALGGLLLLPLTVVPNGVIKGGEKLYHVADERLFYPLSSWLPPRVGSFERTRAEALRRHFVQAGLQPRLGIGCIGIVGYHTNLPITDVYGLTDREIARAELVRRSRPGHEKLAAPAQILARDILITDLPMYPEPYVEHTRLELDGLTYYLTRYDPATVNELRRHRQVKLFNHRRHLRSWLPAKADLDSADDQCDLWFLEQFYLSRPDSRAARERLRRRLWAQLPQLGALGPFLLGAPEPGDRGWQEVRRFSFEPGTMAAWTAAGTAFEAGPRERSVRGQQPTLGATGWYVDSFHHEARDKATGTLRSAPLQLDGDVLTLRVAGGRDPAQLAVRLLVGGQVVRRATGCDTELFGRRAWHVTPFRGQTSVIEIVDAGTSRGAHIAVDEIVLWRRTARAATAVDAGR